MRLLGRIGIARIPKVVAEIPLGCAAVLVIAGLGEDLDFPVAYLVVLGRKGILIDADLADGFLGRKLAAAEAVDEDGAAVGSGRRAGERLEVGREVVGVVGERIEVG